MVRLLIVQTVLDLNPRHFLSLSRRCRCTSGMLSPDRNGAQAGMCSIGRQ